MYAIVVHQIASLPWITWNMRRTHHMRSPSPTLKWLAVVAILGMGLMHIVEASDAFSEAMYKGLLFVANGVGALVVAFGIYRDQRGLGWLLGLVIVGGSVVAYVASRTVGLPGLPAEPDAWFEPMGVAAVVCEGMFIILFASFVATQPERIKAR